MTQNTLINRVVQAVLDRDAPTQLSDLERYFPGYSRRSLREALFVGCVRQQIHHHRGKGGTGVPGVWLPGPAPTSIPRRRIASVWELGAFH